MPPRVLLLLPTTSYKSEDFLAAARRLGVDVVVGTDRRQAFEDLVPGATLTFDFTRPARGVQRIAGEHARAPFAGIVGVDDETTVLAALAAQALGLPHNPEAAVRAARDKYETRRLLQAAGLRTPGFRRVRVGDPAGELAFSVDYPCVLKPLGLSASRGVLRADGPRQFVAAFDRVAAILRDSAARRKGGDTRHLLVEDYLPGPEVALEGLLSAGRLRVLALFDKPDPLEGPAFEETLYVTPSRLAGPLQSAIEREAAAGCRALGLREGPVHAELRVHEGRPWIVEIAARTIGGLCSRALRFGAGVSLEELVLTHVLGRDARPLSREKDAAGVMMIPVPRAGLLREIRGLDAARAAPLVEEVTLTVHRGTELLPLPEGDRYVGFIVARGASPQAVEHALRQAHLRLDFDVR